MRRLTSLDTVHMCWHPLAHSAVSRSACCRLLVSLIHADCQVRARQPAPASPGQPSPLPCRRHEAANTRLGTYGYFAPEVLRCQLKSSPFDAKSGPDAAPGYDSKVDVWSLGVLAYEVLVGKAPFAAASPEGILEVG